jgi:hypothetical protein
MNKGIYEIQNYEVEINGSGQTRQRIIYYNENNEEILRGRFYGDADEIKEGFTLSGGTPPKVMRWQFRTQLHLMESPDNNYANLEDYITYLISQMTGEEKIKTEHAWDYANTISRYSDTVNNFTIILNLTEEEVNNIFKDANNISI